MKEKLMKENILELLKIYKLSVLDKQKLSNENEIDTDIKEYDFKNPKKFTKDQFNSLHSVYDNYSRILSSYISGNLRTLCNVNLIGVTEQNYNTSFIQSNRFLASANLEFPNENIKPSQMYVELSKELSFSILDKMLGGDGDLYEIKRDFTNFELGILDNFVSNILALMKDPWSNFINIEPSYLRSETNFHLIKGLIASETTFMEIDLEIIFKNVKGTLKFLIPSAALEDIFKYIYGKNSKRLQTANKTISVDKYSGVLDAVRDTELNLTGVLGKTNITLNDLVSLSIGDIIQLDSNNLEATLCVDDMPWFKGKYLTKTKHKSIKISNIIP